MDSTVLIIDDEESIRFAFRTFLSKEGYNVLEADDLHTALEVINNNSIDVIFSDIILNEFHGIDLLRKVKEEGLNCPVIMITGQPDMSTAADAVRLGAFDYLIKPIEKKKIIKVAKMAYSFKKLEDDKKKIAEENIKYQKNLEAIFRSVSEAIITFDADKSILNVNKAARNIFNIIPSAIIGKKIDEVSPFSSLFPKELFEDGSGSYGVNEYRIRFKEDQSYCKVLVLNSSPLLDSRNSTIGTVLAIRDETKLATLEKQLNQRYKFHNIIGKSKRMQQVYSLIENLSEVDTTVLITGESGTGKELVAGALHHNGTRVANPFICLNCSALSENLLESELFGHVKGAFTGAIKDKNGRFHDAHKGTLFLDEIGDISPLIQLKLLRVLQEKKIERVGDSVSIDTDVRIIAATNRDLRDMINNGNFREDLFYRLKVVEIKLPSLRERVEDIPLLVDHFIKRFNERFNKEIRGVTNDVLQKLMSYSWPGNIRELEHAIEHAFVLSRQGVIKIQDFPVEINQSVEQSLDVENKQSISDRKIVEVLEKTRWNKAESARILGISRQTLYRKMKKSNIEL